MSSSGGAHSKTKSRTTLCWNCQRAAGPVTQRCEWSKIFRPVPGWIALPAPVTVGTGGGKHTEMSYHVIRCPQFCRMSASSGARRRSGMAASRGQHDFAIHADTTQRTKAIINLLSLLHGGR